MIFNLQNTHVGNVLNYDTGEGKFTTILDWQDIKWLTENPKDFNEKHFSIILSGQQLSRLGWIETNIENGFKIRWGRNGLEFINRKPDGELYYQLGSDYFRHIKYVHQLQNLHWAITETQLVYKIPK